MTTTTWLRVQFTEPPRRLTTDQQREADQLRAPGWQNDALCAQADPEAWFPEKGAAACAEVFRVCASCPVQRACLASALIYDEHGVWAGTTAHQRRDLYRRLRAGKSLNGVLDLALDRQQASAEASEHGIEDAA